MPTRARISMIKIAQKELGIEDDDYRTDLRRRYSAESCTHLTDEQADDLIADFVSRGFTPKPSKKKKPAPKKRTTRPRRSAPAGTIGMISPKQRKFVEALISQVEWRAENGAEKWMESCWGWTFPRTSKQASMVIEALKAMKARAS